MLVGATPLVGRGGSASPWGGEQQGFNRDVEVRAPPSSGERVGRTRPPIGTSPPKDVEWSRRVAWASGSVGVTPRP